MLKHMSGQTALVSTAMSRAARLLGNETVGATVKRIHFGLLALAILLPASGLPAQTGLPPQFSGSVPAGKAAGVLSLSLKDAIDRGLKQNLGLLLDSEGIRSTEGQRWRDLSALLPHLNGGLNVNADQLDLKTEGFLFAIPGVPPIIGPYGWFDLRGRLNLPVFDWRSIEQTRSDSEQMQTAKYTYKDARELVVFAVAAAYLQTIADSSRVDTALAQRATAQALAQQAQDQLNAGTAAAIDALRAKVELQTREQQLIAARNDLAKQQLTLARVIGLPLGQEFTLTDKPSGEPIETLSLEEALQRAYASRPDYQAALAQVRAAQLARKAAVAENYPTVSTSADYGDLGLNPAHSHGTVNAQATLSIPIFQGGSVHGDTMLAEAALKESQEQLDNLRAQIDQDVRNALFDLQSAADQVAVARSNVDLANQTLEQARDRFRAGVADNIEVVQAQESVASASESFISSLYAYNVSKVELGRAIGNAEAGVEQYLKGK